MLFRLFLEEFQVQTIHEGSVIDVKVDFSTSKIHFWHNDKYQGYTECINNPLKEGAIYPAASFSAATDITFCNDLDPELDMTKVEREEEEEENFNVPFMSYPSTKHVKIKCLYS